MIYHNLFHLQKEQWKICYWLRLGLLVWWRRGLFTKTLHGKGLLWKGCSRLRLFESGRCLTSPWSWHRGVVLYEWRSNQIFHRINLLLASSLFGLCNTLLHAIKIAKLLQPWEGIREREMIRQFSKLLTLLLLLMMVSYMMILSSNC